MFSPSPSASTDLQGAVAQEAPKKRRTLYDAFQQFPWVDQESYILRLSIGADEEALIAEIDQEVAAQSKDGSSVGRQLANIADNLNFGASSKELDEKLKAEKQQLQGRPLRGDFLLCV